MKIEERVKTLEDCQKECKDLTQERLTRIDNIMDKRHKKRIIAFIFLIMAIFIMFMMEIFHYGNLV